MPKTTFDSSNVRSSGTSFPTLKLVADEIARIVLAEDGPTYEWVHRLNKPKLSPVTGKLITKEITIQRTQEKKTVPDEEFVGTPICLGSDDILQERGSDPDHCPVCQAAMDYPDWFSSPERKFAVHVLKYATQAGTARVVKPLSLTTLVWRLSEKRYAKVASIVEEFGGNPMAVDLQLGPCTNANFQNYELAGLPTCAAQASEEDQRRARETYEGNNAGDLSAYCGRKADPRYMRQDVDEIVARWTKVVEAEQREHGGGAADPVQPDFSGTLADSGSTLIEGPAGSGKAAAAPASSLSELDDTVGGKTEEEDETAAAAPTPEATPEPGESTTPARSKTSFSDLFADLNK